VHVALAGRARRDASARVPTTERKRNATPLAPVVFPADPQRRSVGWHSIVLRPSSLRQRPLLHARTPTVTRPGPGAARQPPTTLSLDLNTYSYVLALLFLYAFRRRRRRPALHSHSHTACSIGHRKPGALQKFLAFFLFRLGPREAFHAFF
jgi:hypothetical protein